MQILNGSHINCLNLILICSSIFFYIIIIIPKLCMTIEIKTKVRILRKVINNLQNYLQKLNKNEVKVLKFEKEKS